jgi:hypothetical protein
VWRLNQQRQEVFSSVYAKDEKSGIDWKDKARLIQNPFDLGTSEV